MRQRTLSALPLCPKPGGVQRDCRARVCGAAEQAGYQDITYFSATFKKLVGMSPSEYRDTSR